MTVSTNCLFDDVIIPVGHILETAGSKREGGSGFIRSIRERTISLRILFNSLISLSDISGKISLTISTKRFPILCLNAFTCSSLALYPILLRASINAYTCNSDCIYERPI